MKYKPVRVCDISRILRLSSTSLIDFLTDAGYSIIKGHRSPLSSRMLELIQTGYHEGPPFMELNPYLVRAEEWESENHELVKLLHTPQKAPARKEDDAKIPAPVIRHRKPKPVMFTFRTPARKHVTGKISVTPIDLELIQRVFALEESYKIVFRDYLRKKSVLRAISQME